MDLKISELQPRPLPVQGTDVLAIVELGSPITNKVRVDHLLSFLSASITASSGDQTLQSVITNGAFATSSNGSNKATFGLDILLTQLKNEIGDSYSGIDLSAGNAYIYASNSVDLNSPNAINLNSPRVYINQVEAKYQ
jgi:hypothetical protein